MEYRLQSMHLHMVGAGRVDSFSLIFHTPWCRPYTRRYPINFYPEEDNTNGRCFILKHIYFRHHYFPYSINRKLQFLTNHKWKLSIFLSYRKMRISHASFIWTTDLKISDIIHWDKVTTLRRRKAAVSFPVNWYLIPAVLCISSTISQFNFTNP